MTKLTTHVSRMNAVVRIGRSYGIRIHMELHGIHVYENEDDDDYHYFCLFNQEGALEFIEQLHRKMLGITTLDDF